jgi:hypothetical protein
MPEKAKRTEEFSAFSSQLEDYFKGVAGKIGERGMPAENEKSHILQTINRVNFMADVLRSEYPAVLEEEKKMVGACKIGKVKCIDGRFPDIFPIGPIAEVWEEPAALIETVEHTEKDGTKKIYPKSTTLGIALDKAAGTDEDLIELVMAHTSLQTSHKCGKMAGLEKQGKVREGESFEDANIRMVKDSTIPAIENFYNDAREKKGKEKLETVCVPAVFDTDTFGIILDYERRGEPDFQPLSTTQIANQLSGVISANLGSVVGAFGEYKNTFTDATHFIEISKRLTYLTGALVNDKGGFEKMIYDYLDAHHSSLTSAQKQALLFTVSKTVAFQYMTGTSATQLEDIQEHVAHPFTEHNENYMSISLRGRPFGHGEIVQSFGSTPSDSQVAIDHILTKISILDGHKHTDEERNPYILFVSNPVDKAHFNDTDNKTVDRERADNGKFVQRIYANSEIRTLINEGKLRVVSVLVDDHYGEVLSIEDSSAFISDPTTP